MSTIKNAYDILVALDVRYGNPNGDPDNGNYPRQTEDGYGFITDVCIKRFLRNFVIREVNEGLLDANANDIYITKGTILNARDRDMAVQLGIADPNNPKIEDAKKKIEAIAGTDMDRELLKSMCQRYFDIRTFGGVMTLNAKCAYANHVTGPVQIGAFESMDVITPERLTLTRCTVATESEGSSTFGEKVVVPYALYHGFVQIMPSMADVTGFSEEDLKVLVDGFVHMLDEAASAGRGQMRVRKVVLVKHTSKLRNISMARSEEILKIKKKADVDVPHSYHDYEVTVDTAGLPDSVTVTEVI